MTFSEVSRTEGYFQGEKSLRLFYQGWLPSGASKAIVVIAHGIGEHGGRYQDFARHFVNRGYGLYVHDHRGHGRSEGRRGYVEDFSLYVHDLKTFVDIIKEKHSVSKLFLMGHSMGGTIATAYAIAHQKDISGLILTGAGLIPGESVSSVHIAMAPVLSALVPRAGITALDISGFCRDKDVVARYNSDPLNYHGKILARTGAELLKTMRNLPEAMPEIKLPVLIMHGTADRICNLDGSRLFFEKAGSTDKTLKLYDGCYHELFNEPEKEKVLADIEEWLDRHLIKAPNTKS